VRKYKKPYCSQAAPELAVAFLAAITDERTVQHVNPGGRIEFFWKRDRCYWQYRHGIRADAENMGERSKKPGQSSRSEYNNLKLTREELLALFQEDIRLMQKAGIQIEVIPQLYPHIFCGVVLKNVTFIDDDFRMIGDG
jgi:hypothetical protein